MTQEQFDRVLEGIRQRYRYLPDGQPEIWTCKRGKLNKIWTFSQLHFSHIIEALGEEKTGIVIERLRGIPATIITYTVDE